MKITRTLLSKFLPHPATEGPVRGVIVDVTPPERRQTPYGEKDVFRVVIESEVETESGERYVVWSRRFTPTLSEKSSFRRFLILAFGRDVSETDVNADGDLDVDALCIGHPVLMTVEHQESEGNVYANLSHIMPYTGDAPLRPSGKYVRKGDRAAARRERDRELEATGVWQTVKVHVGRSAGKMLGDLELDAVETLIGHWLPKHEANPRPAPEDERLAGALNEAKRVLEEVEF